MSVLALFLALVLEQLRPGRLNRHVHQWIDHWLQWVMVRTDTSVHGHAQLTWAIAVGAPSAAVAVLHGVLLWCVGAWAALVLQVLVLYGVLGFRQFSHHLSEIRQLIAAEQWDLAAERLSLWSGQEVAAHPQVLHQRLVATAVVATHQCVFGVFVWFAGMAALGLGPAGAVLYRLSLSTRKRYDAHRWHGNQKAPHTPVSVPLTQVSAQAWQWVDRMPARITVLGFAVVGRFEDTIDAWRRADNADDSDALIVAAAASALGLQLNPAGSPDEANASHPLPQAHDLPHVVALVWRTVLVLLLLLLLLTLANLLG